MPQHADTVYNTQQGLLPQIVRKFLYYNRTHFSAMLNKVCVCKIVVNNRLTSGV